MDLIAGMSCSGHLPGKMEQSGSSAEIFRRTSAKEKAPECLDGCLLSGACSRLKA
ncbi:MAG: hypothetical protein UT30_C0021G0008 [Candidatus Uhrbacteria bacterium GW2011_GWF2_39_13]|uniref:Uncharacterized protein n=1 Tax=Candidatus Uhrbacteria bacterium GW2011_GWF2_39_13 TaxID=1618995 RepID=A0A0G0MI56_9BACT|nr:MAG: hypothetical protein UT30_C0021G0008 [Candidatus Uhrbacteria bacterium GW2011_GWF2_39_13]